MSASTSTHNYLSIACRWSVRLAVLTLLVGTVSCGVMPNGRRWGQDAFSNVNRKTLSQAAYDAFFDVKTLLPTVAGIVFATTDLDDQVSDWARDHTPIFRSEDRAEDASDYLRLALQGEALATLIAAPSGPDAKSWWQAKLKGFAVEGLAVGITAGSTEFLKRVTNRTRPDQADDLSVPSGHSSNAFAMATLANRNLNTLNLSPWVKNSLQVGNLLIASGTAWARIEGGKHFPSDALAGAAIGHFLSAFIHDAFIGTSKSQRFQLMILPSKEGAMAHIFFPF